MDSLLTLLPTAKQDWKIRVRISKKWEQLRPSGQVFGISMIFVDENDLRIHAWMKSSIISRLDDSLVECGVFQIENFIVRPYGANERNRCFTGDKRIFLTEATVVMPCLEPHEFIPKHVFDCIPLNTWDQTVKDLASVISNPTTRKIVPELIYLIRDINGEDRYDIFPIYKLCPKAKNKQSFLHSAWFPNQRDVWISLCDKVVSQSENEVDIFDQNITDYHILQTNCAYCSMQCMFYRVAYGIYV
ncbi:hypothetical protein ACET3Z_021357 [Daucus carota]